MLPGARYAPIKPECFSDAETEFAEVSMKWIQEVIPLLRDDCGGYLQNRGLTAAQPLSANVL
jgi:hypothetical protein